MKKKIIQVLIILIGVALLVYPWIANYLNEHAAKSTISTYENEVKHTDKKEKEEMLEKAREYNESLVGKVNRYYLNEEEMSELNRVVTMYLDFAEDQARRHIPMYMKDWEEKLNSFLNMTGREVLSGAGHVSAEQAKKHALKQYEIYDEHSKCRKNKW